MAKKKELRLSDWLETTVLTDTDTQQPLAPVKSAFIHF